MLFRSIAKIDSIIYQNGYVDKLNIHRVENSLPQLDEMDSTKMLPRLTNYSSPFRFDNGMVLDERQFEDFLRINSLTNI